MKFKLIILLCILSHCLLKGQHAFGARAGIGSSLLTSRFNSTDNDEKQVFIPQFTLSTGFVYSYTFQNGLIFHADPNYFLMRGKERMSFEAIYATGPSGTFVHDTIWRVFNAVAIPVNMGIVRNRWTYLLGAQFSYYFMRHGREKGSWTDSNGIFHTWENESKEDQFGSDKYDYGLSGGAIYSWNDKFSFDVRAFVGLNNLTTGSISDSWKWKVYLITFGVNYSLYRSSVTIPMP
jgi:hypothetical protein